MIKLYFAPNWGYTVEQMVFDYIQQTPGSNGIWNNLTYTYDVNDADYLVIQDSCSPELFNRFKPEKRLYFSREALTPFEIDAYPENTVIQFSFWNDSGILWVKWWYPYKHGGVNKTYDFLLNETPIPKSKSLTCIQSNKRDTPGHKLRHDFLKKFVSKYPNKLDLYGGIEFSNKTLHNNDKCIGLDEYKYCICFDNQDNIKNFFGTQFTDAMLRWSVPIYWGGASLEDYFPPNSYIKLDIRNENEIDNIIEILNNDDYQSRIPDIIEARKLILKKYNMWPIIEHVINQSSK